MIREAFTTHIMVTLCIWRKMNQNMMPLNLIMSIHIPRKMPSDLKRGPWVVRFDTEVQNLKSNVHDISIVTARLKNASLKTDILPVIASNLLFYPLPDDIELLITTINTLRPRQNGRYFPDDIFKRIFLNANVWISIKISLKFVPKGPINNIPALVHIMAWRRPGDKPLCNQWCLVYWCIYTSLGLNE